MEFNLKKTALETETKLKEKKKIYLIIENGNRKLITKQKPTYDCDENKLNINYSYLNIRNNSNFNNKFILTVQSKLHFRPLFYLLILYALSFINHSSALCLFKKSNLLVKLEEITLKTKGSGTIKILSDSRFLYTSQCNIFINNEHQNELSIEYPFNSNDNDDINTVRITWESKMDTTIGMFTGCNKIIEIDLSKFDTSDVGIMTGMFSSCSSLTSINLSNIKTSKVTSMASMFAGCSQLISLDLSDFDTSKINDMSNMFSGCTKLEYINFKSLQFNEGVTALLAFASTTNKLTICCENAFDTASSTYYTLKDIHCNNQNPNNINKKCYSKQSTFDNQFICDICGKNYASKNNNQNNNYINCYGEIDGYYLDETDFSYKQCYDSCEICERSGNNDAHNCLECKDEYSYERDIPNTDYKNCYIYNPFQIITSQISLNNHYLSLTTKVSIYFENNELTTNMSNSEQNIAINYDTYNLHQVITNIAPMQPQSVLEAIEKLVNDFNIMEMNRGIDKKIVVKNKQVIFTSTLYQKIYEETDNISINLGQCENKLKNNYSIPEDSSLFILEIITEEMGMKIPKIDYEIYYPFSNNNVLEKLNLNICKDTKIDITIPVKIDEELEKYNASSDYYNNICSKTTSKSGTDISLNDRRNEFVYNNKTLCEENCKLIDYDYIKEKAKCSCDIKTSISSYDDIKFDKKEFFKSFIDINNIFNIKILKCYKTVFKIKELKNNYGFFIVSFILLFYFITLFIFSISSYSRYKKEIKNIILALKFNIIAIKNNNQIIKKPMIINKNKKIINKNYYAQKKNKIIINKYNKNKIRNNKKLAVLNNKNYNSKFLQLKNEKINKINNLSSKKILERKEFEINSLNYHLALKIDHRNYCQYYCYLLKYNHSISFSFASYNDYNIQIIKKFLFFFSFCLDFTINALFFTDETIHKIYQDKGQFNFLYQIPQTLYSTLIGKFIDTLIKNLSLTQDIIIELKQEKIKMNLERRYKKLIRTLNIKFTFFFIFVSFFWYYFVIIYHVFVVYM